MQHKSVVFRGFAPIVILLIFGNECIVEANHPLEDFAYKFYDCLVHFINYAEVNLNTKIPVVLSNPLSNSVTKKATDSLLRVRQKARCSRPFTAENFPASMDCLSRPDTGPRWRCVAQFYILPPDSQFQEISKGKDPIPFPFDKLWTPSSQSDYRSEFEGIENMHPTRQMYNVFVKNRKNQNKVWKSLLQTLSQKESPGNSMVATFAKNQGFFVNDGTNIEPKLLLVNNYNLAIQIEYEVTKLGFGTKRELDRNIQCIHAITNNPDTKWLIPSYTTKRPDEVDITIIQTNMNTDALSFHKVMSYLPHDENIENNILTILAVGSNVSYVNSMYKISVGEKKQSAIPTIIYDTQYSNIMPNEPQELEYITCYTYFRYYPRQVTTIIQTLVNVKSIFENRVWWAIFVCYIGSGVLLALIYNTLIKKRVKNPLKFCPFTFGVRALLNQSADRVHNSKRFGFMAWVVIPWLLLGVVLNHAFRGDNIRYLNRWSNVRQRSVPVHALTQYNISVYSAVSKRLEQQFPLRYPKISKYPKFKKLLKNNGDHQDLLSMLRFGLVDVEPNILAKLLMRDYKLAIVSTSDVIAKVIYHFPRWVDYTKPYSYYYDGSRAKSGWGVYNCWDNKVFNNIGILHESGVAAMWKSMKKRLGKNVDRNGYWSWGSVYRVGLECNISSIFLACLCALVVASGVWVFEIVRGRVVRSCKKERGKKEKQTKTEETVTAPEEPPQVLPPVVVSEDPYYSRTYVLDEGLHTKLENLLVEELQLRHRQQLEPELQVLQSTEEDTQNLKEWVNLMKVKVYQEDESSSTNTEPESQHALKPTKSEENKELQKFNEMKEFANQGDDYDFSY